MRFSSSVRGRENFVQGREETEPAAKPLLGIGKGGDRNLNRGGKRQIKLLPLGKKGEKCSHAVGHWC